MSEVIPPSSAPVPPNQPPSQPPAGSGDGPGPDTLPISDLGQVCYERVLPSQAHYYKVPEPPKGTGEIDIVAVWCSGSLH